MAKNKATPDATRRHERTPQQDRQIWELRCALDRICDHGDPKQAAAWSMAYTAITALVTKDPQALGVALRWAASELGAKDADSPDLVIVGIAHHVRMAAELFQGRHDRNGAQDEHAPVAFHDALVAHAREVHPRGLPTGGSVPSVDELRDWLARHGPGGTGGRKLSTETIVARIMVRCGLLGARPAKSSAEVASAERSQRDRVRNALARHPHW